MLPLIQKWPKFDPLHTNGLILTLSYKNCQNLTFSDQIIAIIWPPHTKIWPPRTRKWHFRDPHIQKNNVHHPPSKFLNGIALLNLAFNICEKNISIYRKTYHKKGFSRPRYIKNSIFQTPSYQKIISETPHTLNVFIGTPKTKNCHFRDPWTPYHFFRFNPLVLNSQNSPL